MCVNNSYFHSSLIKVGEAESLPELNNIMQFASIRLRSRLLTMANTLAYHAMMSAGTVESFIKLAPEFANCIER